MHKANSDKMRQLAGNPLFQAILEQQRTAFKAKFGRDMDPHDPLLFDPHADTPTPLNPDELDRMMVDAMTRAGWDPMFIHAWTVTGLLASTANWSFLSKAAHREWLAACNEYRRRHGQAPFTLEDCLRQARSTPLPDTGETTPDELRALCDADAWIARLHDTIHEQGVPFALVTYDPRKAPVLTVTIDPDVLGAVKQLSRFIVARLWRRVGVEPEREKDWTKRWTTMLQHQVSAGYAIVALVFTMGQGMARVEQGPGGAPFSEREIDAAIYAAWEQDLGLEK